MTPATKYFDLNIIDMPPELAMLVKRAENSIALAIARGLNQAILELNIQKLNKEITKTNKEYSVKVIISW